ncbi:hypothetical protein BFL35_16175 [Clavibacter michiganensis]|nr:hypothetical protein BFL35_16175 [Clavibacter michiganensis]
MAMRCRCPPENWLGYASSASSSSPTRFSSRTLSARTSRRGTMRCSVSSSASIAPTLMRGLSDEYGSWNTIWIRRLASRSRRAGIAAPWYSTSPEVGAVLPTRIFASVDLPDPDSPTRARISPFPRCRSTPSSAVRCEPASLRRVICDSTDPPTR